MPNRRILSAFNLYDIFISSLSSAARLTLNASYFVPDCRGFPLYPYAKVWGVSLNSRDSGQHHCFPTKLRAVRAVYDRSRATMPETAAQENPTPPKESSFSIKNLLNCDRKPSKPKTLLSAVKGVVEGAAFSLPHCREPGFPRFEIPAQRFALPAHYLERSPAWWYPCTLSPGVHLPRTEGKASLKHRCPFLCTPV